MFRPLETEGVPAPSDIELAAMDAANAKRRKPVVVTVGTPACTCTHGIVDLPDGNTTFCIECRAGLELELKRISDHLLGLADRMAQIAALEAAGKASAWQLAEHGQCETSYHILTAAHDWLHARAMELKAAV